MNTYNIVNPTSSIEELLNEIDEILNSDLEDKLHLIAIRNDRIRCLTRDGASAGEATENSDYKSLSEQK